MTNLWTVNCELGALARIYMKAITLCLLISLTGNSLVLPSQAQAASETDSAVKSSAHFASNGKAPVKLTKSEDGRGFSVSVQLAKRGIFWNERLVSIDNKNLSKLNGKEISELFLGPIGSTIDVSVLNRTGGRVKTYKVEREPINPNPMWERRIENLEFLDWRSPDHWNSGFAEDSLDILARDSQDLILRRADEMFQISKNSRSANFCCAALTNYQVGNLRDGDILLAQGLKEFEPKEDFRLGQNWNLRKAVSLLIMVNRENEAMQLCDMEYQGNRSTNVIDASRELILNKLQYDKGAAIALLDKYVEQEGRRTNNYCQKWVGDIYLSAGENRKALEVYERVVGQQKHFGTNWEMVQLMGATMLPLSVVRNNLGEKAAAIGGLEEIIRKFDNSVTPEQNALIESMPGVFPKLSDLKSGLESLRNGKAIDLHCDVEPFARNFPPVRKCHDAIAAGNEKLAKRIFAELLDRYKDSVPQPLDAINELNLHSAILTLIREASDRNWLDLANNVLRELKDKTYGKDANVVAGIFLQFEIAYNNRNSKAREKEWNALQDLYTANSYSWSETLRRLSVAYYYANEFQRAEYLINQAFTASDAEVGHSAKVTRYGSSFGEKNMMQIFASCIAAKQNKFKQAEAYWKQFASSSSLQYDGYRHAAMELSSVYLKKGDKKTAIEILRTVHLKPADSVRYVDNAATALDLQLAKLLLESGEKQEAYEIAKSAEKLMSKRLHWDQILVVASCAEAVGDFELAANNYGLARMTAGGDLLFREKKTGMTYMEKAVNLAEKVPNFDKKRLVEIYKDFAMSVPPNSDKAQAALDAYKKAYSLLPESDPQKANLLMNIANLNNTISSRLNKPESNQKGFGVSDDYLNAQIEAARIAEKNHQPNAGELWSRVANSKGSRGEIDAALVDVRHMMKLYSVWDVANHQGILANSNIVIWLVKHGRKAEAQNLLIEAVQRTKAVAGQNNIATQAQCIDLFEFYVKQKNYRAAETVLTEALSGDLTTGETLTHYMSISHCGPGWPQTSNAVDLLNSIFSIVLKKVPDTDPMFVLTVAQKVLKAQDAALKPNDERLVPTLAQLGDIYFNLQKYGEAEKHYDRAYSITKQYQKGEFAVRQVGKHFLENLRKLGKNSEADKLVDLD